MAQAVTVQSGDSVVSLIRKHRGVSAHEASAWLPKVRRINPHISNLDLVHAQEKVLLPERRDEMVLDGDVWQNAFAHIPATLVAYGEGGQMMYVF